MLQLRNQGMVLGEDGDKMSKSKGNVIAPDVLVNKYGADSCARLHHVLCALGDGRAVGLARH